MAIVPVHCGHRLDLKPYTTYNIKISVHPRVGPQMHFENKLAMASKLIKINQLSYGRHLDRGHGHCEPSVHSGHRNDMSTVDQTGSGHWQWSLATVDQSDSGHCGPTHQI